MRRRVRWLSRTFLCCVLDLVRGCVLVLMCAAQPIPARGREAKKATNRRRRLFPLDICLIPLPDVPLLSDARTVPACGNPATILDCADTTGLKTPLATKKFSCQE